MTLYTIRPGFTIRLGSNIYLGGQQVDLNPFEFQSNKHKLEGVEKSVLPLNLGSNSGQITNFSLTFLPPSTWTDFASDTVADFRVLSEGNDDLTDSFEYRKSGGKWQLKSLVAQSNLHFIF
jgi:hypothetical protein